MKKHLQKSLGYYSNINNIIVILVDLPKEKECWHTLQDELLLKCVSGFGDIMPAWTRFFFFSGKSHLLALLRDVNACMVRTVPVYVAIWLCLHCSQQKE